MPYKDLEKQRDYQRKFVAKKRAKWVDRFGGRCCKCGSTEELEFDHINPEEKTSHRIWSRSEAFIEAELSKCQLLCENCHKNKTRQQRQPPVIHGTMSCYQTHKCRCLECRAANAAYEYKRRKGYARQRLEAA